MPSTNIFYQAEDLPRQLQLALQRLELSYRQAAEEIGVSCPALYRIGQGDVPNVENYLRIKHWLKAVEGQMVNRRVVVRTTIARAPRPAKPQN